MYNVCVRICKFFICFPLKPKYTERESAWGWVLFLFQEFSITGSAAVSKTVSMGSSPVAPAKTIKTTRITHTGQFCGVYIKAEQEVFAWDTEKCGADSAQASPVTEAEAEVKL